MTLTKLFRLHAFLALLYAFGLLVAPEAIVQLFSTIPLNEPGVMLTRIVGATLVLVTLVTWGTSRSKDAQMRRIFAKCLFVYTSLGLVITVSSQLTGTWKTSGWINVISYLIFVVGYGYFLWLKPVFENDPE